MAIVKDKSLRQIIPLNRGVDYSYDDNVFVITPSDTVPLTVPVDEIYVGGAGAVTIKNPLGVSITFAAVPVGTQLRVGGAAYVMATGTTATNLVGLADTSQRIK